MGNCWAWYNVPWLLAIGTELLALERLQYGSAPRGLLSDLLTTPSILAWTAILVAVPTYALYLVWKDLRKAVRSSSSASTRSRN